MRDVHPIVEHLAMAAVRDRGVPLARQTRSLLEHCFQTDLGSIRLHFSPDSARVNRAYGSLAFTVGQDICLLPQCEELDQSSLLPLLAHEVAHSLQKSCALTADPHAPRWLLEAEADLCAAHVLRGEPVPLLTADPSSTPRCWDVQGHYYTVLWASLAAGLSPRDAERNSFFTQMPDQVSELDAIAAGLTWGGEFGKSIYASLNAKGLTALSYVSPAMHVYLKSDPSVVRFWQQASDDFIDEMVNEWTVQTGLHALTGGKAEDETKARAKILDGLDHTTFEFGLALHPYGDSFAHRDLAHSVTMYPPPMGHLTERAYQLARKQWASSAHDPDNIHKRPDLYQRYGLELYEMFKRRWGIKKPPIERDKFGMELNDVASESDPALQIASIIGYAAVALVYSADMKTDAALDILNSAYRPEQAPRHFRDLFPQTWGEFYADNHSRRNIELSPDMLKRALACAAQWTGSAKPAAVLLEY